MSNLLVFRGMTKLDIIAPNMLRNIADEEPEHAVVFAVKNDEITYHSSTGDVYKMLYYVESFKNYLMNGGFEE